MSPPSGSDRTTLTTSVISRTSAETYAAFAKSTNLELADKPLTSARSAEVSHTLRKSLTCGNTGSNSCRRGDTHHEYTPTLATAAERGVRSAARSLTVSAGHRLVMVRRRLLPTVHVGPMPGRHGTRLGLSGPVRRRTLLRGRNQPGPLVAGPYAASLPCRGRP